MRPATRRVISFLTPLLKALLASPFLSLPPSLCQRCPPDCFDCAGRRAVRRSSERTLIRVNSTAESQRTPRKATAWVIGLRRRAAEGGETGRVRKGGWTEERCGLGGNGRARVRRTRCKNAAGKRRKMERGKRATRMTSRKSGRRAHRGRRARGARRRERERVRENEENVKTLCDERLCCYRSSRGTECENEAVISQRKAASARERIRAGRAGRAGRGRTWQDVA